LKIGPKARLVADEASSLLCFCAFCLAVVTLGMLDRSRQSYKILGKKKKGYPKMLNRKMAVTTEGQNGKLAGLTLDDSTMLRTTRLLGPALRAYARADATRAARPYSSLSRQRQAGKYCSPILFCYYYPHPTSLLLNLNYRTTTAYSWPPASSTAPKSCNFL
jgi:hypothetical protein